MLKLVPGVTLAVLVAAVAKLCHGFLPAPWAAGLGSVVLAVLLGLVLGNLVRWPAIVRPGVRFSFRTVLRLAIVLLGARLSLERVLAIGGKAVIMILVLMILALSLTHALGRWVGISPKLASLIGVGTAVCGNSAIAAAAPVIGAEDEDVSFAIATNTLFGTLAVFLYPILGHLLGMDDPSFGTWAGTAVNDTSQVVAAGFAYSLPAGEIATAVKLTRNALMGPAIVALGFLHAGGEGGVQGSWWERVRQSFPGFVLGFLVMVALRSVGALDAASAALGTDLAVLFSAASKNLILVALAAVGLSTQLQAMRRTGLKPLLIGFAVATATALTSLLLIHWLGPAGG